MPTKTNAKPFSFTEDDIQRDCWIFTPSRSIHPIQFYPAVQAQFPELNDGYPCSIVNPLMGVADCYAYVCERDFEKRFISHMVKFINDRRDQGGRFLGAIVCALNFLGATSAVASDVAYSMQMALTDWCYAEGNLTEDDLHDFYRTID